MQFAALLIAAALALGCQRAPALPAGGAATLPAPAPHVAPSLEAKAHGDTLLAAGDYRAAAQKYRDAIALDADDMSIRFGLGAAHTFLGQKAQAIEAFRVVVTRGDPASKEYREARRWLIAAGVPVTAEGGRAAPAGPTANAEPAREPEKLVGGRLVGQTEWPGIDPKVRSIRGELWLEGAEPGTEQVKRNRPLSLGGRYHFYDVPPGQYRIIAKFQSTPSDVTLWDQKVTVLDGRPTELTLTPATSLVPPDKFPATPAG